MPPLTWVLVVIVLFPLIHAGPAASHVDRGHCRRSDGTPGSDAIDFAGKATVNADDYVRAVASSIFGVVFAYLGARVIYGARRGAATLGQHASQSTS